MKYSNMKKLTTVIILVLFFTFDGTETVFAQKPQTDFEKYKQEQQQAFTNYQQTNRENFKKYKDSLNFAYSEYLKKEWKVFLFLNEDNTKNGTNPFQGSDYCLFQSFCIFCHL